jgi:tetratricopeptide (TPR) repeat protein
MQTHKEVKTSKRHKADKSNRPRKSPNARKYPVISRPCLWLFRIVTPILIPAILFGLGEIGLRIAGYGYSTNAFSPCRVSGELVSAKAEAVAGKAFCNNARFAWQFFPHDIARDFSPFVFSAKKPSNTYRIFVLGESAAQGVPEPAFSFGRILEVLLNQTYSATALVWAEPAVAQRSAVTSPQLSFEVITLAMPAINSYAVLEITQDCLKYQPDLLVVYLGNNEVVGPYGAGTVFAPLVSNRSLIRAGLKLKSIRLGQLLNDLLHRLPFPLRLRPSPRRVDSGQPQRWAGLEMFLGHQVRAQDPGLNQVYQHFQANLADIRDLAIRRGVPILFSTVAVNLKDCPPFASQHRLGISDGELQVWELQYQQGLEREEAGDFQEAIRAYQNALIRDPDYAETYFRLGRCYWETQQYEQAFQAYSQAREQDSLRFRADRQINQLIRQTAQEKQEQGVYFVDAEKAISTQSEHQIPGEQWFYEHVHFNFAGNYLLARILFEQVEQLLPESIKKGHVSEEAIPNATLRSTSEQDCARILGYTILDQYKIAKNVLEKYITRPPFTNQAYHAQLVQRLEANIEELKDQVTKIPFESFLETYKQAIEQNPSDWHLHWIYASLLASEQGNDQAQALQHYQLVQKRLPLWPDPYVFMGLAASKLGRLDDGIAYNKKAIALDHTQFEAYFNLGLAYQLQQKHEQAVEQYRLAIRYQPSHVNAYMNLGFVLFNQGKIEEAIETYIAGEKNIPAYPELYYNLGVIYEKTGKIDDAVKQYRKALDIDPNSMKYRKALEKSSRYL